MSNPTLQPDICKAIADGQRIQAIKMLRQSKKLSLRVAIDTIDDYCTRYPHLVGHSKDTRLEKWLPAIIISAVIVLVIGYWYFLV